MLKKEEKDYTSTNDKGIIYLIKGVNMDKKIGRNDPCPCGSGKKFKQCCFLTKGGSGVKKKLTAKWINQPKGTDLMERTFGAAIRKMEEDTSEIKKTEE